jgi:hypothetical protein
MTQEGHYYAIITTKQNFPRFAVDELFKTGTGCQGSGGDQVSANFRGTAFSMVK